MILFNKLLKEFESQPTGKKIMKSFNIWLLQLINAPESILYFVLASII